MNFHFEMKVEVCCDEDGFEGPWFPMTPMHRGLGSSLNITIL